MEGNKVEDEGVGSFAFFRSFYETIEKMPDEEALKFIKMICRYCFDEILPDENTDWAQMALFQSIKKTLDISVAKSRAGKKGGERSTRGKTELKSGTDEEEMKPKPDVKKQKKPKKEAKPKVNYAEFVTLTEEEYGKLVAEYGEQVAQACIKKLDDYKGSTGKTYKSDYRTIPGWVLKAVRTENPQLLARQMPDQGVVDPNVNPYG